MDELLFGGITGSDSMAKVKEIEKALTVGYGMEPTTQTGFGALRYESLERTLKEMSAKTQDATFFNAMRKGKAYSTVEEFATLNEVGSAGFYSEGGLPPEWDEDIRREFEQVKYIGAVGKVPIPAQMTKQVANSIDTITRAKAAAIIRSCDVNMHFGDSTKVPTAWNGYLAQFNARAKYPTENTIDLRGKRLTPENINTAGSIIRENYGNGANLKLWIGNTAWENYTDELLMNKRFMVGTSEARSVIASADKFKVGNAQGNIETDIFLRHKGETYLDRLYPKLNTANTAFASTHSDAPVTLAAGVCTATVEADAVGLLDAGTYDYAFLAINKFGASAAFEIKSVVCAANKKVTFVISDNGSPTGKEATSFEIYRKLSSDTALTSYRFLVSFASSASVKVDNGGHVPGTTYGFLYDWDFDQVVDFKQLLPMVKMPLATIDDSIRWLQKQYGVPLLYNPNKMVVFKNMGDTPSA